MLACLKFHLMQVWRSRLVLLWLFFTLAAWRCAVVRDFAAHRLFMIRSYGLALVLVWLRVMYDMQDWLFFYVKDEALRDTTREWASWVVPLLVLEAWLSWVPLLRRRGLQAQDHGQTAVTDRS